MKPRLSGVLSLGALIGLSPVPGYSHTMVPGLAVRVRVYNYSQASRDALGKAQKEAGRILAEAGLPTFWVNCLVLESSADSLRDPCREQLGALDLELRVLPKPMKTTFYSAELGFAVAPILASVYYDGIMRLATSDAATFEGPILLGCIIAHELGHLLLGSDSHSTAGIMQARLDRGQVRQALTGRLSFSRKEAQHMQREVTARAESQEIHP